MKGYLMMERSFVRGQDTFVESFPPDHRHGVVFEDDGETAYFYAVEKDAEGQGVRVLDALHIYESSSSAAAPNPTPASTPGSSAPNPTPAPSPGSSSPTPAAASTAPAPGSANLSVIWSSDWMAAALIIDGSCHAIFDFAAKGGYNINEFPPPNSIWTKGERKLTIKTVKQFF